MADSLPRADCHMIFINDYSPATCLVRATHTKTSARNFYIVGMPISKEREPFTSGANLVMDGTIFLFMYRFKAAFIFVICAELEHLFTYLKCGMGGELLNILGCMAGAGTPCLSLHPFPCSAPFFLSRIPGEGGRGRGLGY